MTEMRDEQLPEGAKAAQELAAESAPEEASVAAGSPDADHEGAAAGGGDTGTGGVVDSGNPDA